MYKKTIKKIINFSGVGIHSGKKVNVVLYPASSGSGIFFKIKNEKIKLSVNNIVSTSRSITIGNNKAKVNTIEHLISVVYMMEITDLIIEVDNEEVPILDGSGLDFYKLLKKAGFKKYKEQIDRLIIMKPTIIKKNDRFLGVFPSDNFSITYIIDFDHPDLKNRRIHFENITPKLFFKQIAPARTFGFMEEVKSLRSKGLAKGGSFENAVVLSKTGYLTKKLRFKDECLRHKVLDLIGAIALLRKPVKGHFIAYKSGHTLDIELIKKISNIK